MSLPDYVPTPPHVMLQVFTIILYQNVFQNPELFGTQVSLSPEQSTLVTDCGLSNRKVGVFSLDF
jgi:hypothetical protein